MMTTCYKAVRPDGRDFHSGTVRWLPPVGEPLPDGGLVVRHPTARRWSNGAGAAAYLSVSTVATDCTGMEWPCRLAEVEQVPGYGVHKVGGDLPHKRASVAWRVVREVDAHLALGPQGVEVAAIIERASRLTADEMTRLYAARNAAWNAAARNAAARDAAWAAAWDAAARDAARYAARNAARNAAWAAAWAAIATLARDLITDEHYQVLMAPWLEVVA